VCRWFAKNEDDGAIRRRLRPSDAAAATTSYRVTTYTGDVRGAGTDAEVWVELVGELEGKEVSGLGPGRCGVSGLLEGGVCAGVTWVEKRGEGTTTPSASDTSCARASLCPTHPHLSSMPLCYPHPTPDPSQCPSPDFSSVPLALLLAASPCCNPTGAWPPPGSGQQRQQL
jgi:hypothetical protein